MEPFLSALYEHSLPEVNNMDQQAPVISILPRGSLGHVCITAVYASLCCVCVCMVGCGCMCSCVRVCLHLCCMLAYMTCVRGCWWVAMMLVTQAKDHCP